MNALVEFPIVRRGGNGGAPWTMGRGYKYPWQNWIDGETHVLCKGKDFHVSVDNFRVVAYQTAYRLGIKVHVHKDEAAGTVSVQFYKKVQPKGSARAAVRRSR